jgi:hypothetical protein
MKLTAKTHLALIAAVCTLASVLPSSSNAQSCALYPIALSADLVANVDPNTVLSDIPRGTDSGTFGWLTWTGDSSESALVASLTAPGNSETYTNPLDPSDNEVSVGDLVEGKPGASNSSAIRDVLAALDSTELIVPLFDQATGGGNSVTYHVSGFARVQIIVVQNRLTVLFLGLTDCGGSPGV